MGPAATSLTRPWSWTSRIPTRVRDWIVVAATGLVGALSLAVHTEDQIGPAGVATFIAAAAVLALQVVPLVWVRRRPVAVLLVVTLAHQARVMAGFHFDGAVIGIAAAMYFVGAYGAAGRWLAWWLWVAWTVATVVAKGWTGEGLGTSSAVAWAVIAGAFLVGDNVRSRRAYLAELEARLERERRQIEQERELAAAQERTRIARELHDVVAHHVSAIAVHADAFRAVRPEDPGAAAMSDLASSARASLAEISRMLGVLRHRGDSVAPRAPEPALDQLERLIGDARTAGLQVDLQITGAPKDLSEALSLSAYRIVQESLTNAMKHARGSRVSVRLGYGDKELDIRVADDGSGSAAQEPLPASGRGIVGMRERVSAFGGTFRAGVTPLGGFEVWARLPLDGSG